MQNELGALPTKVPIQILGVNEIGLESGNASITSGRTLPWLQDVPSQGVWASWQVTFRDVIVLDAQNHFVGAFNLTTHNLSNPTEYDALKTLLVDTANAQ
jgi:hypothetical protein